MNGIKCDGELDGQLLTLCKLLQQSVEDMDDVSITLLRILTEIVINIFQVSYFTKSFVLEQKLDELQLQTWIVAGVCGGVALILIFIVIALFSQVYR